MDVMNENEARKHLAAAWEVTHSPEMAKMQRRLAKLERKASAGFPYQLTIVGAFGYGLYVIATGATIASLVLGAFWLFVVAFFVVVWWKAHHEEIERRRDALTVEYEAKLAEAAADDETVDKAIGATIDWTVDESKDYLVYVTEFDIDDLHLAKVGIGTSVRRLQDHIRNGGTVIAVWEVSDDVAAKLIERRALRWIARNEEALTGYVFVREPLTPYFPQGGHTETTIIPAELLVQAVSKIAEQVGENPEPTPVSALTAEVR